MAEAPELSEEEAARLLVTFLGRAGVAPVELIGQGEWSRCFGFTLDGRELVARFGHRRDEPAPGRR